MVCLFVGLFFHPFYTIALSSGVVCAKNTGQDGAEQQKSNKTVTLPEHAAKGEGKKKGHEGKTYDVPPGSDHPKTVTLPEHAAKGKGKKKGHEGKTYDEQYPYLYDDSRTEMLASKGASIAIAALLKGMNVPLSNLIAGKTSGIIMSLIFSGGDNPNADILNDLDEIKTTLTHIETELQDITDLLDDIKVQLQIDTKEIELSNLLATLNDYTGNIHAQWINYLNLRNTDGTWNTDKDDLDTLSVDILDGNNDMFNQLVHIHDGLTGEGSASDSVFRAMAEMLALKVNAGGDRLVYYHLLESYFGSMLQAETRAATLMVEALRYRADSNSELGTYLQTADVFMGQYINLINDQVEHFLNATEYFVTSTAHPTKGLADFVPDADTIFMRADLTAAFLSTLHQPDPDSDPNGQKMIVYRVIGSPIRVATYPDEFDAPNDTPFRRMLYDYVNQDSYDIPTYGITSHHSWSASPYVQFHPGVLHGNMTQAGVISDASEIWVGKYYTDDIYSSVTHDVADKVTFYLRDFNEHVGADMEVRRLNSNGQDPVIWESGTGGNPGAYYVIQNDGNFVIYNKDHVALWSTGTQGHWLAYYEFQDDGNFVIYDPGRIPLWSSGTYGNPGAVFEMRADGNFVISQKNTAYLHYGFVLDIQHPPALLRGHWVTNHYHNAQSGLSSMALTIAGNPSDTADSDVDWVNPASYLHVNAWPTVTWKPYAERYLVDGSFNQEFANQGWYQWAGDGSPTLRAQFTVYIEKAMYTTSNPGTHWWGNGIQLRNALIHLRNYHFL